MYKQDCKIDRPYIIIRLPIYSVTHTLSENVAVWSTMAWLVLCYKYTSLVYVGNYSNDVTRLPSLFDGAFTRKLVEHDQQKYLQ